MLFRDTNLKCYYITHTQALLSIFYERVFLVNMMHIVLSYYYYFSTTYYKGDNSIINNFHVKDIDFLFLKIFKCYLDISNLLIDLY